MTTRRTANPGAGLRKPPWLRLSVQPPSASEGLRKTLARHRLHTVCHEARCPNADDCHARGTATFMILGSICTRACGFCAVTTGRPEAVDPMEPLRLALAARELKLEHVVITSVDRDDLADGGAGHFRRLRGGRATRVAALAGGGAHARLPRAAERRGHGRRRRRPTSTTTTSRRRRGSTGPCGLRPISSSRCRCCATCGGARPVRSRSRVFMLGLGESRAEIELVMRELRSAGVDIVTIGQYLRPSMRHLPVERWVPPGEFEKWAAHGRSLGFRHVFAGPLVRSSYHAAEQTAQALA